MRRWISFDTPTTVREALQIPAPDRGSLFEAMAAYRDNVGAGYRIESYGDGIQMITDAGRGQGRCLFFKRVIDKDGNELLVALLFYKKETQRVPSRILDTARRRLDGFGG